MRGRPRPLIAALHMFAYIGTLNEPTRSCSWQAVSHGGWPKRQSSPECRPSQASAQGVCRCASIGHSRRLEAATAAATLPTGTVGRDWCHVLDPADLDASASQRPQRRLR